MSTKGATKFKDLSQEDTECLRNESERRLKAAWANIIKRYQNVSNNETDEIDLRSQTVVIDRGVIQNYEEHKLGTTYGMHFTNAPIEDADDDNVWLLDSSSKNKVANENNKESIDNLNTQTRVRRRLQLYSISKSPFPNHTTKISSQ
ncbi:24335_t:CDS:1, partial [Dentiscutata erythropus]